MGVHGWLALVEAKQPKSLQYQINTQWEGLNGDQGLVKVSRCGLV